MDALLLSFSNFNLEHKGDTYTVTEASVIKMFFGAGSDIVTLTIAQYFCELCNVMRPSEDESEEFLKVANSMNKKFWIRQVIIPNVTDSVDYLIKLIV